MSGSQKCTWGCPEVAIKVAQWISTEFGLEVTKFFDNLKSERYETSLAALNQSYNTLTEELKRVQNLRRELLLKRRHQKFKIDNCFYIVSDAFHACSEMERAYKFGITGDFNRRLQSYRTSMVSPQLLLLVFVQYHKELEVLFKHKFRAYLVHANHEHVFGITLKKMREYIEQFMEVNDLQHIFMDEVDLQIYNEEMKFTNDDTENETDQK